MYEAEQKQRYLERQIRKWKRIESGSVDARNVNNASNKVKYFKSELRKLLEDKKLLKRNYNREQPIGTVANKPKESILNNRKWLKANFSTQKKFDKHIEKHLKEYGDITPEDYVNIARDLLAAPLSNDIEGFISKDGFLFKYQISTNDFTIGRPDGKISTLYKPIKGYDQWLEEIEKYKGD